MTALSADRHGSLAALSPIVLWASLGAITCALSLAIFGQWLLVGGDALSPIPITAADAVPPSTILTIRVVEVLSTAVALWALWFYLLRPWRRSGNVPLEGLLLLGALVTYFMDTTINYFDYYMAWNKHAINWGTWGAFFPGHEGPTRYAEAMFWGPPMYVYFGVALATIQLGILDPLRKRAGFALAIATAFAAAFLFDLLIEGTLVRLEIYAWPKTIGALTLWAGESYQFPLYESLLVAVYATAYTFLSLSARRDGVSFIERGMERLPASTVLPARFLAATGFAMVCTTAYFVGYNIFSLFADNTVQLPSYLMFDGG